VKSRATRNRLQRACAWALLAALLPATEALANDDSTTTSPVAGLATASAPSVVPQLKKTSSSRPKIPRPRSFGSASPMLNPAPTPAPATEPVLATPAQPPAMDAAPLQVGDPARIAAAAALLNSSGSPAVTAEPAPSTPSQAPALDVVPPPVGDPDRIAAAAALLDSGSDTAPAPVSQPGANSTKSAAELAPEVIPASAPAESKVENEPLHQETSGPEPLTTPPNAAAPAGEIRSSESTAPAVAQSTVADSASPANTVDQATITAIKEAALVPMPAGSAAKNDASVKKSGCSTCGGFHSTMDGPAFHQSFGCSTGQCVPGRKGPCAVPGNECDTVLGNFVANLWQSLCCPDPCYEPEWVPAANASFFADYARPRTITRLRFDRLMDMTHPDRNQYFLKTTNPKFPITLPSGVHTRAAGRFSMDPSMNLSQLYFYQEAATQRASFFVEVPYRQINPIYSPTQAGFADMNLGSKALLFDTEMLQVTFQFRTFLPTGNAQSGLGTAHVSLDPSLLASLKLAPDTFLQIQVGNWIPLGGTSNIAGGMAYWLMSFNQVLAYITPDSPLIGTFEMDGWSFQNGGYSRFFAPTGTHNYVSQSGDSYFNIGPGLRQSICNKVDFGGAITWATTTNHWADPWFRFEMRFLF